MSARPLAARFGAMGASAQERLIRTLGVDRVAAAMDVAERPGVTESRVLSSPDLLNVILDKLLGEPRLGGEIKCSAAAVARAWALVLRRRSKGMLRCYRAAIYSSNLSDMVSDHVYSLPAGGAVVPDYNNSCLSAFSPRGEQLFSASCHTSTAVAVAFLSNDLLWVAHLDSCQLQKHLIRPENRAESIELIARDCQDYPLDIAVAGEKLLLLRDDGIYTAVEVLDLETGDGRGLMLGGSLQMRSAESMAVQGDVVAIADMHNQRVVCLNNHDGSLVHEFGKGGNLPAAFDAEFEDDFDGDPIWVIDGLKRTWLDTRAGDGPGEFDTPRGVAFGTDRLYVSDRTRIQVLRFPEGEVVQAITYSVTPDLIGLAVLCTDGDRLWCLVQTKQSPSHPFKSNLDMYQLV